MLLSDSVGALAGLLLAIPPLKDQWGRFWEWRHARPDGTVVPVTRAILARSLRAKREAFNGYDTILLALGSIGVLASFSLKLFNR
jgi:hypothetical protein